MHEYFGQRIHVTAGSERSFGLVFAGVLILLGIAPLRHGGAVHLWAVGLGLLFLMAALLIPRALRPLNLLWFRVGMVLNRVVTPLVMAALFFGSVMPVGIMMRLAARDPLGLKRKPDGSSYWVVRKSPGPTADSMKDQF